MRLILVAMILLTVTVLAERTRLKPATSGPPQEDIQLGLQAAKEAEKDLVLINNRDATDYISSLGNAIVTRAPNDNNFPFTFKIVNDKAINAFALPGGPVYVNRGAIEAADNEAQIAGVMGHEAGHVILRHGMALAKRADKTQAGLGILGAVFGNSTVGKIAGAGVGLAGNAYLLRNSRDAESQADLMGTQILYDNGYDPMAMVEFFDKLAKEHKGTKTEQFFSNHPIPENRITKVSDEIARIGPAPINPRKDSESFQRVKKLLLAMPDPPKPAPASTTGPAPAAPPAPSTRMSDFQVTGLQLRHPDNWKAAVQGTNITLAPAGGVNEKGDLAYGMLIDVFKPANTRDLDQATAQFLDGLRMGNPAIKIVRSKVQAQLGGQPAQLNELSNTSPLGGTETDLVYTVLKSDGTLQFFVQVAPTKGMPQYQSAFRAILDSVHFR
jgi:Zn-dependent protease with chaperone function